MSKLRSVNTRFWSDNYIIDLDPTEKLVFLYLLTNPSTNMLGIYELHVRKIAFDTGIDKDMILKIFERFHEDGKASYIDGYVALHNFTKHQSYNTNMKKSALKDFGELPSTVRKQRFAEPLLKGMEPLPKGSEPFAEYELEYELERGKGKRKEEKEKKDPPSDYLRDLEKENFDKSEQVKRFTVYCWQSVKANYPDHKTVHDARFDTWHDPLRLLIENDEVELMEAKKLWDWAVAHHFWKSNIRSTDKFRQKYEELDAQYQRESTKPKQQQEVANASAYQDYNGV